MRETWVDDYGIERLVPQIKGRLKCGKSPGHAALREYVIRRDGSKCVECGGDDRLIADHILSRRNGGSHHPDNLRCLCISCNARKAALIDAKYGKAA